MFVIVCESCVVKEDWQKERDIARGRDKCTDRFDE